MKHTLCNPVRSASNGLYICLKCGRVYRGFTVDGKLRLEEVQSLVKVKGVKR
jgi:hypothetical protein